MITYILNIIACSGLLLLIYRIFLANERSYIFNRFYLLFSLVFSLIVPLTAIPIAVKQTHLFDQKIITQTILKLVNNRVQPQITGQAMRLKDGGPVHLHKAERLSTVTNKTLQNTLQIQKHSYLPRILGILYIIITVVMLFRFIRNCYHIRREIRQNKIVNHQNTTIILLEKAVTPHSFLKYIFINKDDYTNNLVEPEIISHEQTHIKQLHSLDIILVELLQAVCWIDPFIPLYRKAIQLNHEFLADDAVIKKHHDTLGYQNLLLAKAGQVNSLNITSQFNYLVTKKRLIMMTENTTVKSALYKQLALIPILMCVFLLFSRKSIANITVVTIKSPNKDLALSSIKKLTNKIDNNVTAAATINKIDNKSSANKSATTELPITIKKITKPEFASSLSLVVDTPKKTIAFTAVPSNTDTVKKMQEVFLSPPRDYTDFTGKLILINGKEVTEDSMKKLPVSSIKSITPFNGTDETGSGGNFNKIYGEKAKNGVIWIVLKSDK